MIGTFSPIAIIGIALVFPGANDAPAFHNVTLSRQRMFRLDPVIDLERAVDAGGPAAGGGRAR